MARPADLPNWESIKAHLCTMSEEDFDSLHRTMKLMRAIRNGRGKRREKLETLNRAWPEMACEVDGKYPWLLELFATPGNRTFDFYSELEKTIQEETDRRRAEAEAREEEQSRQITDEDVKSLQNAEVALLEVIMNSNIQSSRERLDVLRLVSLCIDSRFSIFVWNKWRLIAASNSEESIAKASETIHKELKRRGLSPRR